MSPPLSLPFLSFVLLFLMNGHSSSGREMTEAHQHGATHEAYITGYTSTPDSTHPYTASYKHTHHPSHLGKVDEPYITGYRTTVANEANRPYLTGYRTTPTLEKANQPYVSAYTTNEPYITQYGGTKKESAEDSTKPSITQYGNGLKNDEHYVTQYGNGPKIAPKKSSHDYNEPYITQYGKGLEDNPKESSQDHNNPYITGYGRHPKQHPKPNGSAQDYAATYKKRTENADAAKKGTTSPPNIVDHTEAFKTGFFTLDDLYVGSTMTLQFPVQEFSNFLPRKEVEAIPFSISQLPSVLQLFSVPEDSPQAQSMKGTLEQCEAEPMTGETKICATSIESMLEFVNNIIDSEANKYNILTTSYPKTPSSVRLQNYTISEVSEDIYAPKWVACHPLPYPYAVYYCHFIGTGSKVFKVLLDGEINGDKMEALGICHLDTSDWSPDHNLFQQLGIKPGEDPVCHFFPVKHLLWVPQPSKATM